MRWAIIVSAILFCLGCNQETTVKPPSPVYVQHTDTLFNPQETLSALGLHVRDPDGTPFLTFDREPVIRFVSPYSLDSALPVAIIRKEMTERQILSLTGAGPHIIRFEVVDLNPKVQPSLYDDETAHEGLTATVLVYYGSRTDDSIPISSTGVELNANASAGTRGQSISPELHAIRLEVLEFHLQPIGSSRQVRDGKTSLVYGNEGWKIAAESKGKSADASYLIDRIPINDPSALAMFRNSK